MLKLIIEKELREIIRSKKFALTLGAAAALIIVTFYVGIRNYQVSRVQYEAAIQENIRQMQGMTDWLMVEHRIFLPPDPLMTLVSGISNDIGRTIEMYGRGELSAEGSRYGDAPLFAVFRFLDLEFIFTIVLSLFAILFAYNAINGEKENGTLRLTFSAAVPRDIYIAGKIVGSFIALALPLLLAILLGCLLIPLMGLSLDAGQWGKLSLVVLSGLLYFGVFLCLSVWLSALTHRSSTAFLLLLIIWMVAVIIVPRAAVLLSGRAVAVLSVDDMASQKGRLRAQLWKEDIRKMKNYQGDTSVDIQTMSAQFQAFMQQLSEDREARLRELSARLQEQRNNGQQSQERLALWLARFSPAASFSIASMTLAGTAVTLKQRYLDAANAYQQSYANFIRQKTGGMLREGGMIVRRIEEGGPEQAPIDPYEVPVFEYRQPELRDSFYAALPDMGLLALFNLVFFTGAFAAFRRYDVR